MSKILLCDIVAEKIAQLDLPEDLAEDLEHFVLEMVGVLEIDGWEDPPKKLGVLLGRLMHYGPVFASWIESIER